MLIKLVRLYSKFYITLSLVPNPKGLELPTLPNTNIESLLIALFNLIKLLINYYNKYT